MTSFETNPLNTEVMLYMGCTGDVIFPIEAMLGHFSGHRKSSLNSLNILAQMLECFTGVLARLNLIIMSVYV